MQSMTQTSEGGGSGPETALMVARGLGWFSIGLGLAECLMPQTVSRAVGVQGKETVIQAFGVREILTGVGILMSRDPEPWLWGRVAGDVADLGVLSTGLQPDNPHRGGTKVALLAVGQVTAVDIACASALAHYRVRASRPAIDYGDRAGFPKSARAMRGVALADFDMPNEYRTPEALRSWVDGRPAVSGNVAAR
jgi:hypothetical protein